MKIHLLDLIVVLPLTTKEIFGLSDEVTEWEIKTKLNEVFKNITSSCIDSETLYGNSKLKNIFIHDSANKTIKLNCTTKTSASTDFIGSEDLYLAINNDFSGLTESCPTGQFISDKQPFKVVNNNIKPNCLPITQCGEYRNTCTEGVAKDDRWEDTADHYRWFCEEENHVSDNCLQEKIPTFRIL